MLIAYFLNHHCTNQLFCYYQFVVLQLQKLLATEVDTEGIQECVNMSI